MYRINLSCGRYDTSVKFTSNTAGTLWRIAACACLLCLFSNCKSKENQLVVKTDKISIREMAGISSKELLSVEKGAKLTDLGEVSHFENEIILEGARLRMPWLKVETSDKKIGWIFAGAVQPPGDEKEWLLQKRLDCYFGKKFRDRLNAWRAGINNQKTEADFAAYFREAIALRNIIVEQLDRRADQDGRPDFFWLNEIMPGFLFQRAYRFGKPQLLADYRFWQQKTAKTSGQADDTYMQVCIATFPKDSIESLFPVWRFQLAELDWASQLGNGASTGILEKITEALAQSQLFEPELTGMKEAILEDIMDNKTKFWQSQETILSELDGLISHPPGCITPNDVLSLRSRRSMLQESEKNWIKVNLRAGE